MSFMDKIKSTVSEAGSKAKILVEVNKLRLINTAKQNEIHKLHQQIGEKVANAAEEDNVNNQTLQVSHFQDELEKIAILKLEIEQNIQQINNLSADKECSSCGKQIPLDARICPKCNYTFPIYDSSEHQSSLEWKQADHEDENKK